jgi:hypothetical protein
MARRKIRFELGEIRISGIKLEIDDELESATAAFGAVQQIVAGALQPAFNQALLGARGAVIDAEQPIAQPLPAQLPSNAAKPKPRPAKNRNAPTPASTQDLPALSLDPTTYGNPRQDWTSAQKALWILWAVQESTGKTDLTTTEIVSLFNKYYQQFRTINKQNVGRDLGKERKKNPPTVGWKPDEKKWFLYEAGTTAAKALAHPSSPVSE